MGDVWWRPATERRGQRSRYSVDEEGFTAGFSSELIAGLEIASSSRSSLLGCFGPRRGGWKSQDFGETLSIS